MEEFRICPACNYGRGFHVYFRKESENHRIGLICPGCGHSYDIGWIAPDLLGPPEHGQVFDSHA